MQIRYDYEEIREALVEHLKNQGVSLKGKDVDVEIDTEGGRNTPRSFVAVINVVAVKADETKAFSPDEPAVTPPILGG